MIEFIKKLPKAELHIHIEGSLEPQMLFEKAKKNNIKIPYEKIEDVKKAYEFTNLQSFLDIYYAGANVLITQEDFFDLTWAYLLKCKENNIIHTEIFFDPQTHTSRGIAFKTVVLGISEALKEASLSLGISSKLIACFLRHLSQEEAFKTLEEVILYKELIIGVGLDSSEHNNPPLKFKEVFIKARKEGFKLVAHAGEEASYEYINEAINDLEVDRIDHGVQAIHSKDLIKVLKDTQMPLTVCPFSNIELKVFPHIRDHNIKELLRLGLNVSVNSDDPSYFKGYLNDNFISLYEELNLSKAEILQLLKNSFTSSFLSSKEKEKYLLYLEEIANKSI